MYSKGGSGAGGILLVSLIIGAIIAYWFYEASHFAVGNDLDLTHRSFMPISCSIASDRASDTRQNADVYFWQGNIRIDLTVQGEQKITAHEIIKPTGTIYAWRDDSGYGDVSSKDKRPDILTGIADENEWFCFPWMIPDFNQFTTPGNVTFE